MITGRLYKNPVDGKITFDAYLGGKRYDPILLNIVSRISIFKVNDKGEMIIRLISDDFNQTPDADAEGRTRVPGVFGMVVCNRLYYQEDMGDYVLVDTELANSKALEGKIQSFKAE